MTRAVALRWLLALVAAAALVALVVAVDPRAILDAAARLGWGGFALFFLPSIAIYSADALGWRLCFERPPPVSFLWLLLIRQAGETINLTMPVAQVGGEPVKVLLLQRHGVPASEGVASVIVAKLETALTQFAYVLCGVVAALVAGGAGAHAGAVVATAAALGALGLVGVVASFVGLRRGPGRLLAAASARLGVGPVERLVARHRVALGRLDGALAGVSARHPVRQASSLAVFQAAWFVETLEVWIFARALDLALGPLESLAIAALLTVARGVGSFAPGSLGVAEGGSVLLFVAFGQAEATALAFALARRGRDLVWILLGAATLLSAGLLRQRPPAAAAAAAFMSNGESTRSSSPGA